MFYMFYFIWNNIFIEIFQFIIKIYLLQEISNIIFSC